MPHSENNTWKFLATRYFFPVVIAVCTSVAYVNSFNGVFVHSDEIECLVENSEIEHLLPLSNSMSLHMLSVGNSFDRRPILSLSFAINNAIFGERIWFYHLINLSIHITAALLLFGIVNQTLTHLSSKQYSQAKARKIAGIIALLWAVHPLQTESVTYVIQRAESLMGMFYLLTLYCSIRAFYGTNKAWYAAAMTSCAIGMGCKEVMVTAPLMILLYDYLFVSKNIRSLFSNHRYFHASLFSTWIIVATLIVFSWEGDTDYGFVSDFRDRSPLTYALTQPSVLLQYIRLIFWPYPLCQDYYWPLASGPSISLLIVILLLACSIFFLLQKNPYSFPAIWFFVILAPSSSIVATADLIQEHRAYLSIAGIITIVVLLFEKILKKFSETKYHFRLNLVATATIVAFCACLMFRTYLRNLDYHDNEGFWRANLKNQPQSPTSRFNLAQILAQKEAEDEALSLLNEALRLPRRESGFPPNYADVHFLIASIFENQSKLDEAKLHYQEALQLQPVFPEAEYYLGNIFHFQGQLEKAKATYKRALFHDPTNMDVHNSLGEVFEKRKEYEIAERYYLSAIRYDPVFADAHNNLALLYQKQRKFPLAEKHFKLAIHADPDYTEAQNNLELFLRSKPIKENGNELPKDRSM